MPQVRGKCVVYLTNAASYQHGSAITANGEWMRVQDCQGKFSATLDSLERQHIPYTVAFEMDKERPAVRIEYGGEPQGKVRVSNRYAGCRVKAPAPLGLERCQKELQQAESELRHAAKRHFGRWRRDEPEPVTPIAAEQWLAERKEDRRLGHGLARVWKHLKYPNAKVYAYLGVLFGTRVKRRGQLTDREGPDYRKYTIGQIHRCHCAYKWTFRAAGREAQYATRLDGTPVNPQPSPWEDLRALLGERDYWRGMVEAAKLREAEREALVNSN